MSGKKRRKKRQSPDDGRPPVDLDDDAIAAAYARMSLDDCAEEFGVSRETIRSRLVARGVKLRPPGARVGMPKPTLDDLSAAAKKRMRKVHERGGSIASMAREGGTTRYQAQRYRWEIERGGAA